MNDPPPPSTSTHHSRHSPRKRSASNSLSSPNNKRSRDSNHLAHIDHIDDQPMSDDIEMNQTVDQELQVAVKVGAAAAKYLENMEDELKCGCCQELMYHPVIVSPCGHYFCGACCVQWVKNGGTSCPACRQPSTAVAHSKLLECFVDILLRTHPERLRPADELVEADELYLPSMSISIPPPKAPAPDPLTLQSRSHDPPPDNLARPCPHCHANNEFGWRCPRPIADPESDPTNAWNLDNGLPPGHAWCGYCDELHATRSPSTTRCSICTSSYCGISVPHMCVAPSMHSAHLPVSMGSLAGIIQSGEVYEAFNGNSIEVEALFDWLRDDGRGPRGILLDIIDHVRMSPGGFKELIRQGIFSKVDNDREDVRDQGVEAPPAPPVPVETVEPQPPASDLITPPAEVPTSETLIPPPATSEVPTPVEPAPEPAPPPTRSYSRTCRDCAHDLFTWGLYEWWARERHAAILHSRTIKQEAPVVVEGTDEVVMADAAAPVVENADEPVAPAQVAAEVVPVDATSVQVDAIPPQIAAPEVIAPAEGIVSETGLIAEFTPVASPAELPVVDDIVAEVIPSAETTTTILAVPIPETAPTTILPEPTTGEITPTAAISIITDAIADAIIIDAPPTLADLPPPPPIGIPEPIVDNDPYSEIEGTEAGSPEPLPADDPPVVIISLPAWMVNPERKDCEFGRHCANQHDTGHAKEFNHIIGTTIPAPKVETTVVEGGEGEGAARERVEGLMRDPTLAFIDALGGMTHEDTVMRDASADVAVPAEIIAPTTTIADEVVPVAGLDTITPDSSSAPTIDAEPVAPIANAELVEPTTNTEQVSTSNLGQAVPTPSTEAPITQDEDSLMEDVDSAIVERTLEMPLEGRRDGMSPTKDLISHTPITSSTSVPHTPIASSSGVPQSPIASTSGTPIASTSGAPVPHTPTSLPPPSQPTSGNAGTSHTPEHPPHPPRANSMVAA